MIRIRLAPMGDGHFRRDLTRAEGEDPICEEVLIPASVYPRWAEPFATDLHERSAQDLAFLDSRSMA